MYTHVYVYIYVQANDATISIEQREPIDEARATYGLKDIHLKSIFAAFNKINVLIFLLVLDVTLALWLLPLLPPFPFPFV